MIKNLGSKIKTKRKELGLSISALSQLSGVSPGMISQIEHDLTIPSVYVFDKIISALDGNYMHFFEDVPSQSQVFIMRGSTHRAALGTGNRYALLNPASNRKLEMYHVIFKKEDLEARRFMLSHEGAECGYVLSGKLMVSIQNDTYELLPGDSIYINSLVEHYCYNQHDQDCVCIWAQTVPPYM